MKKDVLKGLIEKVFEMDKDKVEAYAVTVSLSPVDNKSKKFLNKAIDLRLDELNTQVSVMALSSEIDIDGGDYDN